MMALMPTAERFIADNGRTDFYIPAYRKRHDSESMRRRRRLSR